MERLARFCQNGILLKKPNEIVDEILCYAKLLAQDAAEFLKEWRGDDKMV
jgi:hypothetical protein